MKEKFDEAKQKAMEFGHKVKVEATQTATKAVEWGVENKELVIAMIPVAITVVKTGQSWAVNHRVKTERSRIDHTYYDPSTGMHWELKRKATNADRAEILRRKKAGQDTYTILRQMNLIK